MPIGMSSPISGTSPPVKLFRFEMKKFAYLKYTRPSRLTEIEASISTLAAFFPRYFVMSRLNPHAEMHCATMRNTYLGSPQA